MFRPASRQFIPDLLFFKRNLTPEEIRDVSIQLGHRGLDFTRIRCPLCQWQPTASSYWMCADSGPPENFSGGCHTTWNTFTTRGLCPGCGHQWRWTICHSCRKWSLHEDWYV